MAHLWNKTIYTLCTKMTHILYQSYTLFTLKLKWQKYSFLQQNYNTYKRLSNNATTNKNQCTSESINSWKQVVQHEQTSFKSSFMNGVRSLNTINLRNI